MFLKRYSLERETKEYINFSTYSQKLLRSCNQYALDFSYGIYVLLLKYQLHAIRAVSEVKQGAELPIIVFLALCV